MINSSRRGFLRGLAGVSLLSAGGCFTPHPRKPGQKVRLAAVGIMGKGYSDWTPMLKTGLVEMVALWYNYATPAVKANAEEMKQGKKA